MLTRIATLVFVPFALAAAQETAASLRGTVTDSIRRGPLAGATFVVSHTGVGPTGDAHDYTATTDAHGKYAIGSLRPGRYLVTVEHPWLDTTGFAVPAQTVDLTSVHSANVNLAVPSGATIRSTFCAKQAADTSIGLVAGYVKDARSEKPLDGIRVVFAWSDFDVDRRTARATPHDRVAAAATDRSGTFRICGLPVLRTISMQAQVGDRNATGIVEIQVPASGVLVETLRLDPSATARVALSGSVRQNGSNRAVAGAHVQLVGATGRSADRRRRIIPFVRCAARDTVDRIHPTRIRPPAGDGGGEADSGD